MEMETFDIAGPLLLKPTRHKDAQSFFSGVFRRDLFDAAVHPEQAGAGKRGAVYDVTVDVRRGSRTYGRHIGEELSEQNCAQHWVPPDFPARLLHLSENVEFLYKVTACCNREHDGAVAFGDPDIGVD